MKNNKVNEESFTNGRKISLKLICIKLLKNELNYLREPSKFDSLKPSELLPFHKEAVGKPVESINLELLSWTRHFQV